MALQLWQRKNKESIQQKISERLEEDEEITQKQAIGMYAHVSMEMQQDVSKEEKEKLKKLAKTLNEGTASDEEKRM